MRFNQKRHDFMEREKQQAETKRAKAKQLIEEAELHEANFEPARFGRPRLSFFNFFLTILGLVALVLISALVVATYLKTL